MARYILLDNYTGFIWGDSADIGGRTVSGTPVEVAAALDAAIDGYSRTYKEVSRHEMASNETGYHVYRADVNGSEAVAIAGDGQDQDAIDAVLRDCEYVTSIRITSREG